jgi:hypothetical protein
VVRHAPLFLERDLVGADVDAPIDRSRVARDDLAAKRRRQIEAERALAGGSGPDDGNKQRRGTQRIRSL